MAFNYTYVWQLIEHIGIIVVVYTYTTNIHTYTIKDISLGNGEQIPLEIAS
jgi:hypothetical protein